jgi:hypothetical protein
MGRVGAIGRTVTELLSKQGKALRAMGAEVVVGDLLDLDLMHRVIAGCETMYFGMSVSDTTWRGRLMRQRWRSITAWRRSSI